MGVRYVCINVLKAVVRKSSPTAVDCMSVVLTRAVR